MPVKSFLKIRLFIYTTQYSVQALSFIHEGVCEWFDCVQVRSLLHQTCLGEVFTGWSCGILRSLNDEAMILISGVRYNNLRYKSEIGAFIRLKNSYIIQCIEF